MSSYQRILVAVDFSDLSADSARRAVELAGFYGASLVFMHVVEHFPDHVPHYKMSREDMDPEEFLTDRAEKDLQELCVRVGAADAEHVVRLTRQGAGGELLDYARDHDIDLIVLGYQGRNRLGELIAGSTATGVVRSAVCDVLTVRRRD